MTSANERITLVGAGLVGCLWAILLRRMGFEVDLFEKRSDFRKQSPSAGRSINLVITAKGLHGLDLAGLAKKAFEISVPVYGRMIHDPKGEVSYQPYGQEQEFNLSISRLDLNRFLLEEALLSGAKVFFSHDLTDVDPLKKTLTFLSEGSPRNLSYQRLFATDGAGSPVRRALVQLDPVTYKEDVEWLEADYKELFLPAKQEGEKISPALDHKCLHIWARGRHMMMALANKDGSFTVTLYLPKVRTENLAWSFESVRTSEDVKTLFAQEFKDAAPLMPNYIEDFLQNPQGSLGTVKFSKWNYKGEIFLMGDAAHAIVPFFGQGMNSGFDDCTLLYRLLKETKDWDTLGEQYNRIQKPNGDAIADMAVENWSEMSEKVTDPKFQLRKKVESQLEKNFPGLFKSRYGMVTYTLVPYSLTQSAGRVQNHILEKILPKLASIEDLNLSEAEYLLKSEYVPFLVQNKIDLKKYTASMSL